MAKTNITVAELDEKLENLENYANLYKKALRNDNVSIDELIDGFDIIFEEICELQDCLRSDTVN